MADVEEPQQFTSLQARIAALNQQGKGNTPNGTSATFGKRAPPPIPTSSSANAKTNRPAAPTRVQTVNNPPISSGSSVGSKDNNQPIGIKGVSVLPPPPVDRDQSRPLNPSTKSSPLVPARNIPPVLPGRKASQPSLPPRNGSTNTNLSANTTIASRRDSTSSTISHASTLSVLSLTQTGSSTTSAGSIDTQRKLPPAFNDAKLPPLPPSRKAQRDEKDSNIHNVYTKSTGDIKIPLLAIKSTPVVQIRPPPGVERDSQPPQIPSRPKLPSRSSSRNNAKQEPERAPVQPARRLPPTSITGSSALSMGFGQKTKETPAPIPGPRPSTTHTQPASVVRELTASSFDRAVSGKFALIDFYAPYCKYCVELEPVWKQISENFAFASDRLVIAKVDVDAHQSFNNRFEIPGYPTILFFDGSGGVPENYAWPNDVESIANFLEEKTGILVSEGKKSKPAAVPPPINLSSKPTKSQVLAIQSRPAPKVQPGCLLCRDFSSPDEVATRYPRQSLPRTHDVTAYLADVLCSPFSSHTDKARTIFTWLHHNIAYDTAAFFGNRVKHVEPNDNIATGLAVCGGYAGVFSAIALKAGLEAVTVTGHGKGYGHTPMQPGDSLPPPDPSGHAWNAVRIDNGEWKLLDACWGAGNVGNQIYNKHFTPSYFTMSNEEFGLKHFPENDRQFFRADNRSVPWSEYITGPTPTGEEPVQLFGSVEDHGLSGTSFTPAEKNISLHPSPSRVIRFQFSNLCTHWNHLIHGTKPGKPYQFVLKIGGKDGRKDDYVPFEKNEFWYWVDVKAEDLGARGMKVEVFSVETVGGKDARGMGREEYLRAKGRKAMSFGGVAGWELV